MQCNIDQRGRQVRFGWGVLMLICGVVSAAGALAAWWPAIWGWAATVFFIASGVLAIWEARKGYCVVRGMGIKTPI